MPARSKTVPVQSNLSRDSQSVGVSGLVPDMRGRKSYVHTVGLIIKIFGELPGATFGTNIQPSTVMKAYSKARKVKGDFQS